MDKSIFNWFSRKFVNYGTTIAYDTFGNPLNWRNASAMNWTGRQLDSMTLTNGTTLSFLYNSDGLRVSKTVGSNTIKYRWDGTTLLAEEHSNYTLTLLYDGDTLIGFNYGGNNYYYGIDNLGVIHYVYNEAGTVVVTYTYDAWGNTISASGDGSLININPIRYKSYYYDSETGLFYLQSRYYDAVVGRFISADEIMYQGFSGTVISFNLYSYCESNPVNASDSYGYASKKTYSGIVGFGVQVMISCNLLCYQTFVGIEALWFSFTKNNNFGNGILPWVYWFHGGSMGITLDFNTILSESFLKNPKNVLKGFGLAFGCTLSITFFVITAKNMSDPIDYTRGFTFTTGTIGGVTVSKASGSGISTYGVGVSWEFGFKGKLIKSFSFGKLLFGTTAGGSWYKMIKIGKNAKKLYNYVYGKV